MCSRVYTVVVIVVIDRRAAESSVRSSDGRSLTALLAMVIGDGNC